MFTRKRIPKSERRRLRLKRLVLGILVILLVLLSVLVLEHLTLQKPVLVNPVVKSVLTPVDVLSKALSAENIGFTNIVASPDGTLTVFLTDNGEVILSSKQDIRQQVASLQLILSSLTIEGKKLKSLDLRFDRPVISF